ncbi:hypothetical protein EDB89DRAFT_1903487 [Lactarius sanguifluus]|nr:hypothetical protein EDB89DRAFT_1903487 [Lactarius sanguifluus]
MSCPLPLFPSRTVMIPLFHQCVTVQPGRDQMEYWREAQDNAEWAREVRGATAVLERLLESGEYPTADHVNVARLVSYIGHHMTPARDLPRTVRKSLDELAPRLRLECILGFWIWAELESSPL